MAISTRKKGKVAIIDLSGRLALGGGDVELRDVFKRLVEQGETLFVLNLKDVPWMDSAAIGEIVACNKRAREKGGVVKVVLSPKAKELLTVAGIYFIFEVFDDVEAALASFVT